MSAMGGLVTRPADYHVNERIRDVPVSCTCRWSWSRFQIRWLRTWPDAWCPWHTWQRAAS